MPSDAKNYDGERALAREALKLHKEFPFDCFLDNGHLHVLADLFPRLPVVNVFHDSFQEYRRCAVTVSSTQKAMMAGQFWNARVVPNTLNADDYPFNNAPDMPAYALFMGAFSDIKQPMLAIEACSRLNLKLALAGQPLTGDLPVSMNSNIVYVGRATGQRKIDLLKGARVFLQLGTCESFGLTTLEAMLCGTPVVGWPAGGTLDLIRDNISGVFVAHSGSDKVKNVCDAIERAWYVRRDSTRKHAEMLASVPAQIDGYEKALADVTQGVFW
jgi:glycosyltransferase involved in cell wall biosynthesis